METFVNKVIQSYFYDHQSVVFGKGNFTSFEGIEGMRSMNVANVPCTFIVGRITYQIPSANGPSYKNVLIRYSEEAIDAPLGALSQPQNRETRLWQMLIPKLQDRLKIEFLFLKLCVGCATATPSPLYGQRASTRNAVVWELPAHFVPFAQVSSGSFDFLHCSLMVRSIATFHASSRLLRIAKNETFENLNATFEGFPYCWPVDSLLPTLRRCLQSLREDPTYSHVGVDRLEKMLNNLASDVMAPFARNQTNQSCWVVCHQNYGRQSVVFESDPAGVPVQARMFNCQSMGFASLGVDLAILLFVELPAALRSQHYHALVLDYCVQLLAAIGGTKEPKVETVYDEIARSIPYALYVLAGRIVDAQAEAHPATAYFQPNQWTEGLLTNLYRYLIDSQIVDRPPFYRPEDP